MQPTKTAFYEVVFNNPSRRLVGNRWKCQHGVDSLIQIMQGMLRAAYAEFATEYPDTAKYAVQDNVLYAKFGLYRWPEPIYQYFDDVDADDYKEKVAEHCTPVLRPDTDLARLFWTPLGRLLDADGGIYENIKFVLEKWEFGPGYIPSWDNHFGAATQTIVVQDHGFAHQEWVKAAMQRIMTAEEKEIVLSPEPSYLHQHADKLNTMSGKWQWRPIGPYLMVDGAGLLTKNSAGEFVFREMCDFEFARELDKLAEDIK